MWILNWAFRPVIDAINLLRTEMKMDNAAHAAELRALGERAEKARVEIVAKVAALEDALANSGQTSAEVDAAMADLKGKIGALDDLNPDANPTGA